MYTSLLHVYANMFLCYLSIRWGSPSPSPSTWYRWWTTHTPSRPRGTSRGSPSSRFWWTIHQASSWAETEEEVQVGHADEEDELGPGGWGCRGRVCVGGVTRAVSVWVGVSISKDNIVRHKRMHAYMCVSVLCTSLCSAQSATWIQLMRVCECKWWLLLLRSSLRCCLTSASGPK